MENRLHVSTVTLLIASAALYMSAVPIAGHTQSTNPSVPDNARPRSYGSGWECERGFREIIALLVERESLVFFQEFLSFSAEVFVFVAELHSSEMLLGREDKTTGEDQSTEQQ
jgi:hypothetical protein